MVSHGFSSSGGEKPGDSGTGEGDQVKARGFALDPIRSYFLTSGHEAIESDQDEYHADFSK